VPADSVKRCTITIGHLLGGIGWHFLGPAGSVAMAQDGDYGGIAKRALPNTSVTSISGHASEVPKPEM
jgi:hypothetical protein